MIIQGDIYRLTPVCEHAHDFDMELLYDVGGKNPRQEFKNVAYGISLERAIKKIIMYSLSKKFKDEVITLKQYLNAYKEESDKIRSELKNYLG